MGVGWLKNGELPVAMSCVETGPTRQQEGRGKKSLLCGLGRGDAAGHGRSVTQRADTKTDLVSRNAWITWLAGMVAWWYGGMEWLASVGRRRTRDTRPSSPLKQRLSTGYQLSGNE